MVGAARSRQAGVRRKAVGVRYKADTDGWLRMEVAIQDPRHAEWALWQLATEAGILVPAITGQ